MTGDSVSPTIYSIGHSDHEIDRFVDLLRRHGVDILVDVRSQPYSRWVPAYNRDALRPAVEAAGLTYLFMGDALGGRPADPSLYHPDGRPDYERIAATPAFQAGLQALARLEADATVAIMCSEADYHDCHRARLITPHLLALDLPVVHILPDGRTVDAGPEFKQLELF